MLAFARKGKYQAIPMDVHKILNEVIDMLEHSVDKRIRIKKNFRANVSIIEGDPNQIQNVFLNIGLNARDAMPDGGTLSFETCEIYRGFDVHIPAVEESKPGHYVLLKVIDTGMGMEEAIVQRIFEPF